ARGSAAPMNERPRILIGPFTRLQVDLVQFRFPRSRRRLKIVFPAHARRQRHQNRLHATTGAQAEERAAIVKEIELDVPSSPELLEPLFRRRISLVLASLDDGAIGAQEGVAAVANESEPLRPAASLEVVKEDPANASGFVA